MGDPTQSTAAYFFTQGILGVLVVALSAVVVALWRDNKRLQDARLSDSKEVTKEVTAVVSGNTTAMNLFSAKIEGGKQ